MDGAPPHKKAKLGVKTKTEGASSASAPKAGKVRGEAAVEAAEGRILAYLVKFQRPYNCTQLWENTLKVVSKANVQTALNRLVARGSVAEKQYQNGKVSLYYADPDAMARRVDAPTPDELCDILFDDVPRILVETEATRAKALKLERRAAALAKEPTNAELDEALRTAVTAAADVPGTERRDAELAARVEVLASRAWVDPAELAAAKAAHDAALAKWKLLRRVVKNAVDVCADTTDEDVDVAHLAGVFADHEAGVLADPLPLLA